MNGINYVEITDDVVHNVKEKFYYINFQGDVYSKFLNCHLAQYLSPYGYWHVSLKRKDNRAISCKVHRLLMLTFNYIPGCEQLVVNHLDGVKTNNSIYTNLEWTTNPLNTKHAAEHGLMPSCENSKLSILTNAQVEEICQKLEKNPHQSISALAREYNVEMETVRRIATGEGWLPIRSKYKIDYVLNYGRLTPEQVEEMCKIFEQFHLTEDFNSMYCRIIQKLNLEDTPQNRKRISRIFNKEPKNFPYITCKYNF